MEQIQIQEGKIQIRDLGQKKPDPEFGINIPDLQRCSLNFIKIRKEPHLFIFVCVGGGIPQLS